jgi:hypothetical protein
MTIFRDLEIGLAHEVIDWAESLGIEWEDGGMVWDEDKKPYIPVGLPQDAWNRWDDPTK